MTDRPAARRTPARPKLVVLLGALALLAVAWLVLQSVVPAWTAGPAPSSIDRQGTDPQRIADGPTGARSASEPVRSAVDPGGAEPSVARMTFRGLVVADESGIPLAGVAVTAETWGDGLWQHEPVPIAPVYTTPDGRFELGFPWEIPGRGHNLRFDAPGRIEGRASHEALRLGVDIVVGTVRLLRGVEVLLRSVGEQGDPAPDEQFELNDLDGGAWRSHTIVADANGEIALSLPPSHYVLERGVEGSGMLLHGDSFRFTIGAGESTREIIVPMHRPAASSGIHGRAVDELGAAVGGLEV